MPIAACACLCHSSESLIRNFLQQAGYPEWLNIPIAEGKHKSKMLLENMPQTQEIRALQHFLDSASKWAVIIGWDSENCRWADIAHQAAVSKIDARFIVDTFA